MARRVAAYVSWKLMPSHRSAPDAVAGGALGDARDGQLERGRDRDSVLVVLAEEDQGSLWIAAKDIAS